MDARQKAEGRRQKAKGRRQKAEGKRQKAEGRRQKAEEFQFFLFNQRSFKWAKNYHKHYT
ncbi:MAG: hypothetical protein F6K37_12570 [Moorea sp. SIO4E2]|uniref:hypothetical protein n=1 Tax=Moorena sp. SIO4E2 TaxID=2607826 RepID=UPI0013B9DC87|nr:hypothetical protein [Moorena sp. SIO4E2]NEQ06733.1 hypothetical protein [Moorena sp. SIO4E2]